MIKLKLTDKITSIFLIVDESGKSTDWSIDQIDAGEKARKLSESTGLIYKVVERHARNEKPKPM